MYGFLLCFMNNEVLYFNFDIKYFGFVDGYDFFVLLEIFELVKLYGVLVIVYVIMEKGWGYQFVCDDDVDQFYVVGCIDLMMGEMLFLGGCGWMDVFFEVLVLVGEQWEDVIVMIVVMFCFMGFVLFVECFFDWVYDVGIVEQYVVVFVVGFVFGGFYFVVVLYVMFMGCVFDQVLMDVVLYCVGVIFVLDCVGVIGLDGFSYYGMWDLVMLQIVLYICIVVLCDGVWLIEVFDEVVVVLDVLIVIWFLKGEVVVDFLVIECLEDGVDVFVCGEFEDVFIVVIGLFVELVLDVVDCLWVQGIGVIVIDLCWVILVQLLIVEFVCYYCFVIIFEDGICVGGIGMCVCQVFCEVGIDIVVDELGLLDEFIDYVLCDQILVDVGFMVFKIVQDIVLQVFGICIFKVCYVGEMGMIDFFLYECC